MSQVGGAFVTSVPAVPVGSMQAYAGSSPPTGWLLCDGTTASRTTYSNLFSVIGTTYGVGDGSTTFGLPDMRGRVPMGAGTGNQLNASGSGAITGGTGMTARTAGAFGGEETHLLTSAEIPAHSHPVSDAGHTHTIRVNSFAGDLQIALNNVADGSYYSIGDSGSDGSNSARLLYNTTNTTGLTVSNNTGGGGRHFVVPPFVVLNYIIKAIPDTPRGGMTATFTPPIVTSLPLVPQFGDQVVYAADATNGVYWLLQYDASGTYPWKFIGGNGLLHNNGGSATTGSTSYTDCAAASITAPLAGDYRAEFNGHAGIAAGEAAYITLFWNGTNGGDGNAGFFYALSSNIDAEVTRKLGITVTTASTVVKTQVRMSHPIARAFSRQDLLLTPIRVKAA